MATSVFLVFEQSVEPQASGDKAISSLSSMESERVPIV